MSDQLSCNGCFHASVVDGKTPNPECKECLMCLRNPAILSRKDNPKTIIVEGVEFPFPIDMYITRDRLMYEDYMRAKKILQAIQEELDKRQHSNIPANDKWRDYPIYPATDPQPYYPWWTPTYRKNWTTTAGDHEYYSEQPGTTYQT